jgi:putative flippase GtrA
MGVKKVITWPMDKLFELYRKAPNFVSRYGLYAVASAIPAWLDYLLLFLITELFRVYYLYSAIIAFIISNIVGYFVYRRWGFHGSKISHRKGLPLFLLLSAASGVAIIGVLWFEVQYLHFYYLLANLIACIFVDFLAYIVNYRYIFKVHNIKKH